MTIGSPWLRHLRESPGNDGKAAMDLQETGHAALVMPAETNRRTLNDDGPFVIMAGTHNHNRLSLKAGFKSHLIDWPASNVKFYYNTKAPQWPG